MYLAVCPIRVPGSILCRGGVFQKILLRQHCLSDISWMPFSAERITGINFLHHRAMVTLEFQLI